MTGLVLQRVTLDTVLTKYNFDFPFHPEVLKLGLRYADGTIKGANARCIAMLDMLREMVEDYTTPTGMLQPCTPCNVCCLIMGQSTSRYPFVITSQVLRNQL